MWDNREGRSSISQDLGRRVVDRLHRMPTARVAYQIDDTVQIEGHKERQGLMAFDPDCYGEKKTCSVCGIEQSLVFFHKDRKGAKGVRNACKACRLHT